MLMPIGAKCRLGYKQQKTKEIEFDFIDTQPIDFNENTHTSK